MNYCFKNHYLFVNDEAAVKSHVAADDYFGTLATVLSLWRQNNLNPEKDWQEIETDLVWLQKNYRIVKK
jgi:hypothetical protein